MLTSLVTIFRRNFCRNSVPRRLRPHLGCSPSIGVQLEQAVLLLATPETKFIKFNFHTRLKFTKPNLDEFYLYFLAVINRKTARQKTNKGGVLNLANLNLS